jgi:phage N-6-adenine-methyltransferase
MIIDTPPPTGLIPISFDQPRVELQAPLSKAKGKAEMLARWQAAIDAASRHPGTFTELADYAQHQQAMRLCRDYLAEAITHARSKSASVGGGPQAVSTPRPFFEFVQAHLGVYFGIDLAAVAENALCAEYFGPCAGSLACDALTQDWAAVTGPSRWGWLNPPFSHVLPWVRKARLECARGARLVMLLKLAPGTKWHIEEIDGQNCSVFKMRGRLKFPGFDHGAAFDTQVVMFDGLPFRERTWDWRPAMKAAGFEV